MSQPKKPAPLESEDIIAGEMPTPQSPADGPAEKVAEPTREAREQKRLGQKLSKYSILIAEDDQDLQDVLAMTAEERHLKVVRANDGIDALAKARLQAFDAILIDMNLPKKLGHEVVADIRLSGPSRKSVIVVLSGYLKKEFVQALAGKVDKAFTKPADIDQLMDAVITLIEQKQAKKVG